MTREEAISILKTFKIKGDRNHEAFDMAIKALEPCGDAISREELIEALDTWDKFGYAPTNELIPLRGSADKDKYVPYIHYDDVIECIKGMPSVSPRPTQSDDVISRQAVLDIIRFEDKWLLDAKEHNVDTKMAFWAIKSKISELPSVNPNRKAE